MADNYFNHRNSPYMRREHEMWEKKYKEQERRERIERAAKGHIERRATAEEFARDTGYRLTADLEVYNDLLAEAVRQEAMDKAFLEGFMRGGDPVQTKISRDYHS